MKKYILLFISMVSITTSAQEILTPEKLWQLGRINPLGITKDGKNLLFKVGIPNLQENKIVSTTYTVPVNGGNAVQIVSAEGLIHDKNVSKDGTKKIVDKAVKVEKLLGTDWYPELSKTSAQIYTELDYRHWDTYNDGTHNHVFYKDLASGKEFDIMPNEPYDAPQNHMAVTKTIFGRQMGQKLFMYVKKLAGTAYAKSTNTNLYEYDLATGKTVNLTPANKGYDTHPLFSPLGELSWLQMKRDGFEADKMIL